MEDKPYGRECIAKRDGTHSPGNQATTQEMWNQARPSPLALRSREAPQPSPNHSNKSNEGIKLYKHTTQNH